MKVISRSEAKEQCLKRYFTGVPCNRGHYSERNTSCGDCVECRKITDKNKNSGGKVGLNAEQRKLEVKGKLLDKIKSKSYELISEYKNNSTRVMIRCNKGHEFLIHPSGFIARGQCKDCKMEELRVREELGVILDLEAAGYRLTGRYGRCADPVDIECDKGHKTKIIMNRFRRGDRCGVCSKERKERVLESLKDICKAKDIKQIEPYEGVNTKILFRCESGHYFSSYPSNIINNGCGCPVCAGVSPIAAKASFHAEAENRGFTVIGEYKSTHSKVDLICPNGHSFNCTPNAFKRGNGCPECCGKVSDIAYINEVSNGVAIVAIKFGITVNLKQRVKTQNRSSRLNIKNVAAWRFPTPRQCRDAETEIKRILDCGIVSSYDMTDGHTETTSVRNMDKVISIYESFGGIRI